MGDTYPREVIDLKMQQLMEKCDDILRVAIETRDQARMTNGRVNKLENVNERKEGVSSILKWIGIPVISLLIGYLSWIGVQVMNISKTLTAYEITVEHE